MDDYTLNRFCEWAAWYPVGTVIYEVGEGSYYRVDKDYFPAACDVPPSGIPTVLVNAVAL